MCSCGHQIHLLRVRGTLSHVVWKLRDGSNQPLINEHKIWQPLNLMWKVGPESWIRVLENVEQSTETKDVVKSENKILFWAFIENGGSKLNLLDFWSTVQMFLKRLSEKSSQCDVPYSQQGATTCSPICYPLFEFKVKSAESSFLQHNMMFIW